MGVGAAEYSHYEPKVRLSVAYVTRYLAAKHLRIASSCESLSAGLPWDGVERHLLHVGVVWLRAELRKDRRTITFNYRNGLDKPLHDESIRGAPNVRFRTDIINGSMRALHVDPDQGRAAKFR